EGPGDAATKTRQPEMARYHGRPGRSHSRCVTIFFQGYGPEKEVRNVEIKSPQHTSVPPVVHLHDMLKQIEEGASALSTSSTPTTKTKAASRRWNSPKNSSSSNSRRSRRLRRFSACSVMPHT